MRDIKKVEKLVAEFQKGSDSITKQKEKYKSLKTILTSEEFAIKKKREEMEELQSEFYNLRLKQEHLENTVSKIANDVNE